MRTVEGVVVFQSTFSCIACGATASKQGGRIISRASQSPCSSTQSHCSLNTAHTAIAVHVPFRVLGIMLRCPVRRCFDLYGGGYSSAERYRRSNSRIRWLVSGVCMVSLRTSSAQLLSAHISSFTPLLGHHARFQRIRWSRDACRPRSATAGCTNY